MSIKDVPQSLHCINWNKKNKEFSILNLNQNRSFLPSLFTYSNGATSGLKECRSNDQQYEHASTMRGYSQKQISDDIFNDNLYEHIQDKRIKYETYQRSNNVFSGEKMSIPHEKVRKNPFSFIRQQECESESPEIGQFLIKRPRFTTLFDTKVPIFPISDERKFESKQEQPSKVGKDIGELYNGLKGDHRIDMANKIRENKNKKRVQFNREIFFRTIPNRDEMKAGCFEVEGIQRDFSDYMEVIPDENLQDSMDIGLLNSSVTPCLSGRASSFGNISEHDSSSSENLADLVLKKYFRKASVGQTKTRSIFDGL